MKRMYVGNLPPTTTEAELSELFSQFGRVRALEMAKDLFSGRCRGFAFVEMEGHEMRAAVAGLNGTGFKGQLLKVNEERPKPGGRGRKKH